MSHETRTELLKQLRAFGLNAKEWSLQRAGAQLIRLRHRCDPDFQLLGQISTRDNGRLILSTLSIASL